jgi:hypothetical protein
MPLCAPLAVLRLLARDFATAFEDRMWIFLMDSHEAH